MEKQKVEISKQPEIRHQKREIEKAESRNLFQLLPLVLLIIVVMMAMSSPASFSNGFVRAGSIPHSSQSNSSQSWLSSASWSAPPSLDTNSSSDRARDASSACEIVFASNPDVALSVCCFQIFLPSESILFIETCLIVDQFKRSALLSCRDFAIVVLLNALA